MKGYILNGFMLLTFVFLLASCRTAGLYTSNPKDKMAFAGTEFHLMKNDSFSLRSWTDSHTNYIDSNGNRIFKEDYQYRGFGTFECLNDSLELTFSNTDSITLILEIKRDEDTLNLSFQIFNEVGQSMRSVVGIYTDQGERVEQAIFQLTDTFYFEIPIEDNPSQIRLQGFGYNLGNPVIHFLNLSDGRYVFTRKSYNGYFQKGTVKKIWFSKVPSGIRYQMRDKKRYLPRKWGWKWINNLYLDY